MKVTDKNETSFDPSSSPTSPHLAGFLYPGGMGSPSGGVSGLNRYGNHLTRNSILSPNCRMLASSFFLPIQHHGHITSLTMSTFTNGLAAMSMQKMVREFGFLIYQIAISYVSEFTFCSRRRPLIKNMRGYSDSSLLMLHSPREGR